MRGVVFVFYFCSSLCTCFAEFFPSLPCPTVEVGLNNKAEEGEFAYALSLLLKQTLFLCGGFFVRVFLRCCWEKR